MSVLVLLHIASVMRMHCGVTLSTLPRRSIFNTIKHMTFPDRYISFYFRNGISHGLELARSIFLFVPSLGMYVDCARALR